MKMQSVIKARVQHMLVSFVWCTPCCLLIFCRHTISPHFFFCCYKTRKSLLLLPPWARSKPPGSISIWNLPPPFFFVLLLCRHTASLPITDFFLWFLGLLCRQPKHDKDAYKWCAVIRKPVSAWLNRTALPQWTLDVKKYANASIHKRRIEQNTQA